MDSLRFSGPYAHRAAGGLQLTDEEWSRYFPGTEPFNVCE